MDSNLLLDTNNNWFFASNSESTPFLMKFISNCCVVSISSHKDKTKLFSKNWIISLQYIDIFEQTVGFILSFK